MKKLFLALSLLSAFSQCSETDHFPRQIEGNFNEEVSVRPGQTVLFNQPSDGPDSPDPHPLTVRILEATDGRCPKTVQCVRFGEAKVTVKVSQGVSSSETLYLCLGDCDYWSPASPYRNGGLREFSSGNGQYVLRLKKVNSLDSWTKENERIRDIILLLEKK